MGEVRDRLDELRSFVCWTAPLYVIFVDAGLYETHFTLTLALAVLFAVLAAFGCSDGLILSTPRPLRVVLPPRAARPPSAVARPGSGR